MTPSEQHNAAPNSEFSNTLSTTKKRPIWEIVTEIGAQIPDEEWEKVPNDASINYKHYLYAAPRKDS